MIPILLASFLAVPAQDLTLEVDVLHDGVSGPMGPAVVTVRDGEITSVRTGRAPEGAIHVEGAELTPGLIDAFSYMGVGAATVEQSRESTPASRLSDTVDLSAPAFRRAIDEGVTAAFLSPDSLNVMGGLGCFVKTAGGRSANLFAPEASGARLLHDATALKVSVGADPSAGNYPPRGAPPRDMFGRRPTTRMGVTWELRKEFYRALHYRDTGGSGDAELDILVAVLNGDLPLRVQARRSHDVQTALRLQREFGWPNMILEEGTEAHDVAGLLKASGVPVATGPAYDQRQRAITSSPSLEEMRLLAKPPPVCCEDAHEHVHETSEGMAPFDFEEETGLLRVDGLALDVLLAAVRPSEAQGLNNGRWSEGDKATPALAALLNEGGVLASIGSAEAHDAGATEASVIHQARQAVRFGLDPGEALRMVTAVPAQICGVADELGTIERGKDADLVLWSGPPLAADSRPLLVIVDGRIVVDHRAPSAN